ncbi:hypothetical protein LTR17_025324 [Elasticomyces elasticus]|nr:hypothetical protein LTR17_025324 [Elasticomyces elasticus]
MSLGVPRVPTECACVQRTERRLDGNNGKLCARLPGFPASRLTQHQAANGAQMQSSYAFNKQQMHANGYNNPQQMCFLGQQISQFNNNHANPPSQQSPNGESNGGSQADWNRMSNPGGQDGYIDGIGGQRGLPIEANVSYLAMPVHNG